MSAFGRKPDTRQLDFESPRLNVCFHQKRSFKSGNLGEIRVRFRPEAAIPNVLIIENTLENPIPNLVYSRFLFDKDSGIIYDCTGDT